MAKDPKVLQEVAENAFQKNAVKLFNLVFHKVRGAHFGSKVHLDFKIVSDHEFELEAKPPEQDPADQIVKSIVHIHCKDFDLKKDKLIKLTASKLTIRAGNEEQQNECNITDPILSAVQVFIKSARERQRVLEKNPSQLERLQTQIPAPPSGTPSVKSKVCKSRDRK